MKIKIYQQFPEIIKDYAEATKNLSKYLLKNRIANIIVEPVWKDAIYIRGQSENINIYAEFFPTLAFWMRKSKSEMRGKISSKETDAETREKAKGIAKLLIDYKIE